MTTFDMPLQERSDGGVTHKHIPRDGNIFSLHAPGISRQDQKTSGTAVEYIKVDDNTVFTKTRPDRRKLLPLGIIILPAAFAIAATVTCSLYTGPSPDIVEVPEAVLELESAAITAASGDITGTEGVDAASIPPVSRSYENISPEYINSLYGDSISETEFRFPVTDNQRRNDDPDAVTIENTPDQTEVKYGTRIVLLPKETLSGLAAETQAALPRNAPYDMQAESNRIHITQGKTSDNIAKLINTAYTAYTSGHYSVALRRYHEVLVEMPDNRDALLGVAAIAQRMDDPDKAVQSYLRILENNTDDPAAVVGLMDILGVQDLHTSIQTIVKLLEVHPRVAYLYFYLGTLRAEADHWFEAREAFSEACRLEEDNPDYAYNLAVSLDHLGDQQGAGTYYSAALELAHDHPVNFDTSVVLDRIASLPVSGQGD